MLSKEEQAKIGQLCQESSQAMEVCSLMNKQNQLQLSMVSHEIRNPVTLINSFLQLLGSSHPEITSYHYWTEITENMRFLRELLENLSAYNNAQKLSREEVSILSILKTVIADTEPTLSEKNITIQLKRRRCPALSHGPSSSQTGVPEPHPKLFGGDRRIRRQDNHPSDCRPGSGHCTNSGQRTRHP